MRAQLARLDAVIIQAVIAGALSFSHLHDLAEWFDLVWCSGWEEKADEHLPALLGAPSLPHLRFDRNPGRAHAHWKLAAIEAHVDVALPFDDMTILVADVLAGSVA